MRRAKPSSTPAGKGARFGVYLAPETRLALRRAALEEGLSATQLVERLIKAYLTTKAGEKGRGR